MCIIVIFGDVRDRVYCVSNVCIAHSSRVKKCYMDFALPVLPCTTLCVCMPSFVPSAACVQ